jgi:hypothetical protein
MVGSNSSGLRILVALGVAAFAVACDQSKCPGADSAGGCGVIEPVTTQGAPEQARASMTHPPPANLMTRPVSNVGVRLQQLDPNR